MTRDKRRISREPNDLILTESQSSTVVQARRNLLLWIAVPLLATSLALGLSWLPPEPEPVETQAPVRVSVTEVELRDHYETERSFLGIVVPKRRSDLGFPVSERVIEIRFDDGELVREGDVIARLETRRLAAKRLGIQARLKQAEARLRELKRGPRTEDIATARAEVARQLADWELAQATLKRLERSLAENSISAQRYDEGRLACDAAAAELNAARERLKRLENGTRPEQIEAQTATIATIEAELEENRVALEDSVLKAPFTGRIAKRYVDEGTVVEAGMPVVELIEGENLEIRVGLPLKIDLDDPNTQYRLTVAGQHCPATRIRLLPERDPRARTVEAMFRVDPKHTSHETEPLAKIGDSALLHVMETESADGCWLPLNALSQSSRGLWSCSVVKLDSERESTGSIERRELRLLHTEADRGFVAGGLEDRDLVVIAGQHRCVPGQRVEVLIAEGDFR